MSTLTSHINAITDEGNPNNPFRSADKAVVDAFIASLIRWRDKKDPDEGALASIWKYAARRSFDEKAYTEEPYSIYNRCISSADASAMTLQAASPETATISDELRTCARADDPLLAFVDRFSGSNAVDKEGVSLALCELARQVEAL